MSILICSLVERDSLLKGLLISLERQITDDVEILVEKDNGEITIGEKRNILLERATGDYVVFVDDDDRVSNDYISKILKALSNSPDCCAIEGEITRMKRVRQRGRIVRERCTQKFIHSIQYDKWFKRDGIYYRCPNHLNPIRRELALQVKFLLKNTGEDIDFSLRLRPFLRVEEYISGSIYFYAAG